MNQNIKKSKQTIALNVQKQSKIQFNTTYIYFLLVSLFHYFTKKKHKNMGILDSIKNIFGKADQAKDAILDKAKEVGGDILEKADEWKDKAEDATEGN